MFDLARVTTASSKGGQSRRSHDPRRRWLRLPASHITSSCSLPSEMRCRKLPRRSSSGHLHAVGTVRPWNDRHRAVVESTDGLVRSNLFFVDVSVSLGDEPWANAAWIRQSRLSGIDSFERRTGWRKPMREFRCVREAPSRCRAGWWSAGQGQDRYCSAQESVRTRCSPPYRSIDPRKVGRKS